MLKKLYIIQKFFTLSCTPEFQQDIVSIVVQLHIIRFLYSDTIMKI